MGFVTRRIDVITKSDVDSQVPRELEIILNKSCKVVGRPARVHRINGQLFTLRSSENEACKRIASELVSWCIRGLEGLEIVTGRRTTFIQDRELVGPQLNTCLSGVP